MKKLILTALLVCLATARVALAQEANYFELESDQQTETLFVNQQDSLALVALHNSTDGANWRRNTNWLTNLPINRWLGIAVSNGRVTIIKLEKNNLKGHLPSEIGNLTELRGLLLGYNWITGSIPKEIFNLKNLEILSLYDNEFTGEIPPEIGNLTNLTNISLRNNHLTGTIPTEITNLANLQALSVSSNNLSGDIPLEIFTLTNLQKLWLQWNKFTGAIPKEIANLTNLVALSFHSNQLTGPIPPEIFNCTKLRFLYMGNEKLTGSIPKEIGNLVNLESLWLHQTLLTGAVPAELINLKSLGQLWLFDNELTDLPDISSLASLRDVRIENNRFTFEDIEPNIGIQGIHYWPQDSVGIEQEVTLHPDSGIYSISVAVGGTHNQYLWKRDWLGSGGGYSNTITINPYYSSSAGIYTCEITNTIVPQLTIYSRPVKVNILSLSSVDNSHDITLPDKFVLYQNYPNPFNATTTIQYSLPKEISVSLKVLDIIGQEIATLVDEYQRAGYHTISWDATDYSSGVYFCQIQTSLFEATRKMIVLK